MQPIDALIDECKTIARELPVDEVEQGRLLEFFEILDQVGTDPTAAEASLRAMLGDLTALGEEANTMFVLPEEVTIETVAVQQVLLEAIEAWCDVLDKTMAELQSAGSDFDSSELEVQAYRAQGLFLSIPIFESMLRADHEVTSEYDQP